MDLFGTEWGKSEQGWGMKKINRLLIPGYVGILASQFKFWIKQYSVLFYPNKKIGRRYWPISNNCHTQHSSQKVWGSAFSVFIWHAIRACCSYLIIRCLDAFTCFIFGKLFSRRFLLRVRHNCWMNIGILEINPVWYNNKVICKKNINRNKNTIWYKNVD